MAVWRDDVAGSGGEDTRPEAVLPDDEGFGAEEAVFSEELPDRWLLALDPVSVPGQWADAGMVAAFRADNHAAWRRSRWIWEASRATAGTTERVTDRWRAGKIPAASLGWSEQRGVARIEFARQILVRLPALDAAMRAGWLEESKAEIFTSTVADLDDAQARLVVERLLGRAPGWTHAQLRTRVESTAKAVDPGWAEARKAAAIARRRLVCRVAPSGSAELSGLDLPPEPAQDAYDRIVALADVVSERLRAAGRDAPVGPIRTEVLLVLTGPDGAGLFDDDVIELVLARFTDPGPDSPNSGDDDGPDSGDDGPDRGGPDPDGEPDDQHDGGSDPRPDGGADAGPEGPKASPGPSAGPGPDRGAGHGPGSSPENASKGTPEDESGDGAEDEADGDDGPAYGPTGSNDAPADARPADTGSDGSEHGHDLAEGPSGDDEREAGAGGGSAPRAVPFRARVAIRLGLRTVLGLDHRPGEVPDHGSVCSSTARTLAWARTDARWRIHLYDQHGDLEHVLPLRPPACGPPGAGGRRRRHIVELTAHTHELDDLTAGTDLAVGHVPLGGIVGTGAITLLTRAARALAAARARPTDQHPAHSTADAHRRRPGAELARWVQARDRTCRGQGCDHQALGADLDHTLDWLHGGQTTADDLGVMCESDHLFKHDLRSGWTIIQPSAGMFVWTAPTGARHTLTPEIYDPLPDPLPPTDASPYSLPGETFAPSPRTPTPYTPRRNRHGHITRAARTTADTMTERAHYHEGSPPSRYDHDPDF